MNWRGWGQTTWPPYRRWWALSGRKRLVVLFSYLYDSKDSLCDSIKLKRNSWRVFVIVKVSVKYILTTHKPTKAIKTLAVFVALKTSFYVDYDVGKKLSTVICVSHLLWTKGKRDYSLPKLIRHTSFKRLKWPQTNWQKPFSDLVFHTISHGVICFVANVS